MTISDCPTPWCSRDESPYLWQGPDDLFRVICASCNVEGPTAPTDSEAVTAWNNAVQSDPLITAARAMLNDYQTSERHHPDHILVRREHFEAIAAEIEGAK